MRERLERIKRKAELLWANTYDDTLQLDRELGELEMLVHEARCEVDAEWRALRDQSRAFKPKPEQQSTLEDLV